MVQISLISGMWKHYLPPHPHSEGCCVPANLGADLGCYFYYYKMCFQRILELSHWWSCLRVEEISQVCFFSLSLSLCVFLSDTGGKFHDSCSFLEGHHVTFVTQKVVKTKRWVSLDHEVSWFSTIMCICVLVYTCAQWNGGAYMVSIANVRTTLRPSCFTYWQLSVLQIYSIASCSTAVSSNADFAVGYQYISYRLCTNGEAIETIASVQLWQYTAANPFAMKFNS